MLKERKLTAFRIIFCQNLFKFIEYFALQFDKRNTYF